LVMRMAAQKSRDLQRGEIAERMEQRVNTISTAISGWKLIEGSGSFSRRTCFFVTMPYT
jgi:hypothetical protein